jgi:hypothetical protein
MNDIIPATAYNLHAGDGIEMVSQPTIDAIRPAFAKFTKGLFLVGSDHETLPHGTKCIVHGASEGWARLVKGEPLQRIPREPNKAFPTRNELGELDQSQWPLFDGKPSDPWRLVNELLLTVCDTGRPVFLSVSSSTGGEVVCDLCRLITYQRRSRGPTAKAVIALGASTLMFRFGSVAIPKFEIVDWIGSNGQEPQPSKLQNDLTEHLQAKSVIDPTAKSTATQAPKRKKVQPAPWVDDLDDEIPANLR